MHGAWKHRRRCSCTRPSREDARRVSPAIMMPAGPVPSERDVECDGTGITDGLFFTPRLDLRVLDERVRDLLHAVDGRHEAHLRRGAASRPRPRGGGGRAHLEPSADDEAELPRLVREAVRVVGVCGGRERRRRAVGGRRGRGRRRRKRQKKTGAGGRAVHGLDAVVEDDVHELVEALEDAAHCGRARGAAAAARRARMRAPSRPPWNFTRTSLSMHFSRSMIDFDAMLEQAVKLLGASSAEAARTGSRRW